MQEARTGDATVADVVLDHLRALNDGAEPLGSFGAVVGATIERRRATGSTSTARSSPPGTAHRAARSTTCAGSSATAPATCSRAPRASCSGTDPTGCADAADRLNDRLRELGRDDPSAGHGGRHGGSTLRTLLGVLPLLLARLRPRPELLRRGRGPSVRPRVDRQRRRPGRADPGAADLRGPAGQGPRRRGDDWQLLVTPDQGAGHRAEGRRRRPLDVRREAPAGRPQRRGPRADPTSGGTARGVGHPAGVRDGAAGGPRRLPRTTGACEACRARGVAADPRREAALPTSRRG